MIFYFSGTGNSLHAAKAIACHTKEELVSISAAEYADKNGHEYKLRDDEKIGFVFPVYAWGPPRIVLDFIGKLALHPYQGNYVFSIATCGGSIGNTMNVMKAHLSKKGLPLASGFSIKMPNNFVLMGDVDSKEQESKKLAEAEETLKQIVLAIERKATGDFKVDKGNLPRPLSGLMNSMFVKKGIDTAKFHADCHCTGCGTCERVCNCHNIKVAEKPQWGQRCTGCLACLHYCPERAVQFGKGTEKKGRYTNPYIRLEEMANAK